MPCHVVDIMPTILETTGASYLSELGGHQIQPLQGESLMPLLMGKPWQRQQPIFWEHEGNCAIRQNNFKLACKYNEAWELYDMENDRTELNNLIGKNKPLEQELKKQFISWADSTGVLDWNIALPKLLQAWQMEDAHG